MTPFPTGTVTFMFTDLEGSTQLWEQHPLAMHAALARHDEILKQALQDHGGLLIKTTGDGVHAVFTHPAHAVAAALSAQQALLTENWGETGRLAVRMGIHTGEARFRDGDYFGTALNRAARIMSLGHGGQVLLSGIAHSLVAESQSGTYRFRDLGEHTLKGIGGLERIFQVSAPGLPDEFPALVSSKDIPHNLPVQLTSFFGRERELAALDDLLAKGGARLVTLTGPGGTGKTRLSLEAARLQFERFPQGVFFIQLAPVSDPALVPTTIAQTIGLREGGGLPPIDNLKTYLQNKTVLLVLDNLEQVAAAAQDIAAILQAAPDVRCLASSRIPLQISGEHEYFVYPLSLPDPSASAEALADSEAVQLFLARARAVDPGFSLTEENAPVIAEICRRLDGLPLALEIAAARLKLMPPRAVLKRLDRSLTLLTRTAPDLPDRQRTMRAAIDWSYDMLATDAQRIFARLGVFVGGFTLEAAEQTCDPEGDFDFFAAIEALSANSLIHRDRESEMEARFLMLQTIREYALEKLDEFGETGELAARHAGVFSKIAGENVLRMFSAGSTEALELTELENGNFRAALAWGLSEGGDLSAAAQIAGNMQWFWYRHGHFHEGREWYLRLLERIADLEDPSLAGFTLGTASTMAMWLGDLDTAFEEAARGLERAREAGEPFTLAVALLSLGIVHINRGEDRKARPYLVDAAERFDELENRWFQSTTMVHLGNVALGVGEPGQAIGWLEQAQRISQVIDDPWLNAFAANNLGEVARVQRDFERARLYYEQTAMYYAEADAKGDQARLVHTIAYLEMHAGDLDRAEALFQESLEQFLKLGNKRGIAECLAGLAGVGARRGNGDWAAPLLRSAESSLTAYGAAWWPADRVEVEETRRLLPAAIPGESPRPMALDEAVAYARAGPK